MKSGASKAAFLVCFLFAAAVWGQQSLAVPCATEIADLISRESYGFDSRVLKRLDAINIAAMDTEELNRTLTAGDRYASYIPAATMKRVMNLGKKAAAGTGMDIIKDRSGRIRMIPFIGSPADTSGIEYGDVLLQVDGVDITAKSIDDIGYLIRGEEDTDVEITAKDSRGEEYTVPVTRKIKHYPDVMRTGSNPVVIRIFRFGSNTGELLRAEIARLEQEQGAFKGTEKKNRRFFIDLRGNTGGVMEQGARSAELFLNAGKTVYRLKNNHGINEVKAAKSGLAANNRFVIMQDYLTASAAEMMIAALKAGANVGTYGERSAGKARVQDVFRLSDGSFLKLTVGELLYPDSDADRDTNWEGSGIVPDVEKRH